MTLNLSRLREGVEDHRSRRFPVVHASQIVGGSACIQRTIASAAFGLLLACGGSDGASGATGPSGGAVAELVVEGSGSFALEAGESVSSGVSVRALNTLGAPVSGAEILASGDGQLSPATARTGTDGRAVFQWTSDGTRVGSQAATFTAGARTATALATVRPVARLLRVLGPATATGEAGAALSDSIRVVVVRARDAVPVAGAAIRFTVTGGNGVLSASDRITDAQGSAAVGWTLGAVGVQSVAVQATATTSASAASATVSATALQAALTRVDVAPLTLLKDARGSLVVTPQRVATSVGVSYTYQSLSPSVASVSATGEVTALAVGTATIRVTGTGSGTGYATTTREAAATVTVLPLPDALTALTVSPVTSTRIVGQTVALTATPTMGGAGVRVDYTWTSDQLAIAQVSATGVVTALTPGTATIRVRATGSGSGFTSTTQEASALVTVTPVPEALTGLTLSPNAVTRTEGQRVQLAALPTTGGTSVSVSYAWSSDQPTIASVSSTGEVTAQAPGTTTIRVRATGSGTGFTTSERIATATVTVMRAPDALTDLVLSPSTASRNVGQTVQLTPTPTTAGVGVTVSYVWSSDQSTIASVTSSGVVTALAPGTSTIRVRATGSGTGYTTTIREQIAQIIVTALPDALTDVSLSPASGSVSVGQTLTLTPTPTRASASVSVSYSYASSAPLVATVNSATGIVTGLAPGTATITVTARGSGVGFSTSDRTSSATVIVRSISAVWTAVSAGRSSTCGRTSAGAWYCWGSGSGGELGDGRYEDSGSPVRVAGGIDFTAVSVGGVHACGLAADGVAYCWGTNYWGQLGGVPANFKYSTLQRVSGTLRFTQIVAGDQHTCGLTTTRSVFCWGRNDSGQIGNGTTSDATVPMPVSGGLSFAQVESRYYHNCGQTIDRAVYCWGLNTYGNFDGSPFTNRITPTRVATGFQFSALTLGTYHNCGLIATGEAFCWGNGTSWGTLGTGSLGVFSPAPLAVVGSRRFLQIDAGWGHTCGVETTGNLYCWGLNNYGQLGIGTLTDAASPQRVTIPGTVAEVAVGLEHSCARTISGELYCWGNNAFRQLGVGSNASSEFQPKRVGEPSS